ncbi:MAG: hypothetical protein M3P93_18095 [Actinomycetota bacterium]|nr:hypothetical protein [Actinomycetota bacterium]
MRSRSALFTGLGDDDKRDAVHRLLGALTDAVNGQDGNHVQIQVKARMRSSARPLSSKRRARQARTRPNGMSELQQLPQGQETAARPGRAPAL